MTKEKPRAEIDGKEVEVELMDDEITREAPEYGEISSWRLFLPLIAAVGVIILAVILSATLFIWALPVLLPILVIVFIVRLMR